MDGGGFVEGRAVHFVEISVLMAQFPACRGSWSLQRRIEILNEARTRPLGMVLVLAATLPPALFNCCASLTSAHIPETTDCGLYVDCAEAQAGR
jgi:hypothetical protein